MALEPLISAVENLGHTGWTAVKDVVRSPLAIFSKTAAPAVPVAPPSALERAANTIIGGSAKYTGNKLLGAAQRPFVFAANVASNLVERVGTTFRNSPRLAWGTTIAAGALTYAHHRAVANSQAEFQERLANLNPPPQLNYMNSVSPEETARLAALQAAGNPERSSGSGQTITR